MMHLHFDYLTVVTGQDLLPDEHPDMLDAIIQQDAEKADQLALAHTRHFRERFIRYLQENHTVDVDLSLETGLPSNPEAA